MPNMSVKRTCLRQAPYLQRRASVENQRMQRVGYSTGVQALFIVAALFTASHALASNCGMLSSAVDEARTRLKRAADETAFEDAKDYARRAKSALDEAALAAMDCKCDTAYSEFDAAATRARRARDADTVEEFVDSLNRSIRSFNTALNALRACASLRR